MESYVAVTNNEKYFYIIFLNDLLELKKNVKCYVWSIRNGTCNSIDSGQARLGVPGTEDITGMGRK